MSTSYEHYLFLCLKKNMRGLFWHLLLSIRVSHAFKKIGLIKQNFHSISPVYKINLILFKMCNYRCCYWCHSTYLHVCYTIGNFNQELIQELTLLFIALSEIAKPPQKLDIEAIVYYQKITSINQPTRDGKYCYQHQHLLPEKRLTVCKNN